MNDLVFGKYIPVDSLMHRLDPRAKLIGLFLMIAAVFIPKSWLAFLVIGTFILLALLLAKIGIRMIIQSFKPMIMMMVFLLCVLRLKVTKLLPHLEHQSFFLVLTLSRMMGNILIFMLQIQMSTMFR